ncbi:MAG: glycosyltransferase [Candidatus Margulisiibacteriota bacterium]
MAVKISVVIGTYNQKDKLRAVLDSLFRQTIAPDLYEIIVVDSSSTDGTEQMVQSLPPSPSVFKYSRIENKGKPYARNKGIDSAEGDIILLTDADMIADTNLLLEHLRAHEKHENAAFEGKTINPDNNPYIKENLKPGQKLKFSYFLSGNLSIKKKTLVAAGKFDEDFAGYGWEDIELGYRLLKNGLPLYYLPFAINYHDHIVSDEDILKRKYDMGRSAALFLKKHQNLEIRYFIGLNPVAIFIYNRIKKNPKSIEYIANKSGKSPFFRYLLEEFNYRRGLESEGAI